LEQLSLHLPPINPASSSSSIIPKQDFMNTSLDQNISGNIEAITKAIGIPEFNRIELLEIVLIHSSHNNENPDLTPQQRKQREIEYRRLALLGDAILARL
jgi:hypothetical protein